MLEDGVCFAIDDVLDEDAEEAHGGFMMDDWGEEISRPPRRTGGCTIVAARDDVGQPGGINHKELGVPWRPRAGVMTGRWVEALKLDDCVLVRWGESGRALEQCSGCFGDVASGHQVLDFLSVVEDGGVWEGIMEGITELFADLSDFSFPFASSDAAKMLGNKAEEICDYLGSFSLGVAVFAVTREDPVNLCDPGRVILFGDGAMEAGVVCDLLGYRMVGQERIGRGA